MLAAGIRGLVEAAADTFDCFSDVAPTLADSHVIVRRAISGELAEQMALAPEIESSLIHFAYARKLHAGEGPALHNAKTAKDCVAVLAESAPEISAVYASLCEYTHPAAPSIFRFAGPITHPDTVIFDPNAGAERIRELVALSRNIGHVSLVLAVAPLVMTLKVLNTFGVQEVTTLWADTISLSFSGMWLGIDKTVEGLAPTLWRDRGGTRQTPLRVGGAVSPVRKETRSLMIVRLALFCRTLRHSRLIPTSPPDRAIK